MNNMEKEFKALAAEINKKIKVAAKAMKEANKLANDAGLPFISVSEYNCEDLSEEDIEKVDTLFEMVNIYPLFNELDKAGWQTSSIGC